MEPTYPRIESFSEGFAAFCKDGKWGYLDHNGTVAIDPMFKVGSEFSEGLAYVEVRDYLRGSAGGYIDKAGEFVIPPQFMQGGSFRHGLAPINEHGRAVFIDRSGKVALVPCVEAVQVRGFSEGLSAIEVEGKWGFIDMEGKAAIAPQWTTVTDFEDGVARVAGSGIRGYIDTQGAYIWREADAVGAGKVSEQE